VLGSCFDVDGWSLSGCFLVPFVGTRFLFFFGFSSSSWSTSSTSSSSTEVQVAIGYIKDDPVPAIVGRVDKVLRCPRGHGLNSPRGRYPVTMVHAVMRVP
jgi:hypothetical protein